MKLKRAYKDAYYTEDKKQFIHKGSIGWNVYDNSKGHEICGEYLYTARTLSEIRATN